ncbi:MAG TPA: hypothetical protein VG405_13950 [Solirubrobacteraceae bacterium]|jgi:hypothetical protein|nr:hypothetical protein [Solirubrobacteraceae bacterium]
MKFKYQVTVLVAGLALGVTPALATTHGKAHSNTKTAAKLCHNESKQHTKGVKGTPFSVCETAVTKADNGSTKSPGQLCKAEKKMAHHMKGQKGTPFSQCVTAAAKAKKSGGGTTTSTTDTTTTTGTTSTQTSGS